MTRILVVGAGLIGARHIRLLLESDRATLAGIVEPNPALVKDYDVPCFARLSDVNVEIDGAICAVPTPLHAEIGSACAQRGWAVLMEKPVAETLQDADALIEACAQVPLLIGHHRRHHPFVQKTKALIEGGALGDLVAISGVWAVRKPDDYFKDNWREAKAGSPVSINLVHDLDLLRFMVGEVVALSGILSDNIRNRGVEDTGAIAMRFECGATGSFVFTDAGASPWGFEAGSSENPNIAGSGQDCYQFIGTKASLSLPSMTLWEGAPDWSKAQSARQIEVKRAVPLEVQLAHFCDLIDGKGAPLSSGADGRKTLALVEQVMALGDG